ncbi:MAG: hypothetical protein RLZZ175_1500 [Bacteroidota bacterium]|jgi:type I restriction enzyme S subunit
MNTIKIFPQNWELYPLGDIATFSQGIQVGTEQHISELIDGYQRFIRIIDYTQPNNADLRYVPTQGERYYAKASDIVMIRYGTPGVIGRGIEGIIANNMFKISFNNLVLNDFAEHYFRFSETMRKINDGSASSTMPAINFGFLKKLPFIVPPLPEQQKIAEILSTVDAKIELIDQQITETQALKKGLMQRLLTKGIGHTEFKDSPLGKIPKSWDLVELNKHIELLSGFAFKSEGFNEEGKGIKLLRGINITVGKLRWNDKLDRWWDLPFEEIEKYSAQDGDLVISMDGSLVGRNYARVKKDDLPLLIVQRVACLRAKNTLDLEFLNQIIGGSLWLNYVDTVKTSSGIPHISAKNIRDFKIPFPSLKEQKEISEILATISNKLEVLSEKKTHYQELKQGLMQQLLTGKIRTINNG